MINKAIKILVLRLVKRYKRNLTLLAVTNTKVSTRITAIILNSHTETPMLRNPKTKPTLKSLKYKNFNNPTQHFYSNIGHLNFQNHGAPPNQPPKEYANTTLLNQLLEGQTKGAIEIKKKYG